MSYHLAVNRVMGICAFKSIPPGGASREMRDAKSVAKDFYRQMESMCRKDLEPIYKAIAVRSERMGISLTDQKAGANDLEITVIQGYADAGQSEPLFPAPARSSDEELTRDPIIGLFRSRRLTMEIGGKVWDLRIRPSVTACVLEREDRLSKLWWTFEGVPVDASNLPSEEESVRFVKVTTALAEAAMPELRQAYTKALEAITGDSKRPHRLTRTQLRVSFADNTDSGFSRLVDAMNLAGVPFEEAAAAECGSDLRAGADEVVNFVTKTSGQAARPSEITLTTGRGGLAAVYTKPVPEPDSPDGMKKFVISGLASSIGMISNSTSFDPEWTDLTTTPDLVRSISAARPPQCGHSQQGSAAARPFKRVGCTPLKFLEPRLCAAERRGNKFMSTALKRESGQPLDLLVAIVAGKLARRPRPAAEGTCLKRFLNSTPFC